MRRKIKLISLLVAAIMLVAAVTPVFADTGDDPTTEPTPSGETSKFLDNPIVKLLAGFFSNLFQPPATEEPPADGDVGEPPAGDTGDEPTPEATAEGGDVEEPTPVPTVVPEAVVASLHEDAKLGFGDMTKLMQLAVANKASCAMEGVNCDVTLDNLVAEFKSGTGMGLMFQKYGKPDNLGVGQVRKEANTQTKEKEKTNNGKAVGKNK